MYCPFIDNENEVWRIICFGLDQISDERLISSAEKHASFLLQMLVFLWSCLWCRHNGILSKKVFQHLSQH